MITGKKIDCKDVGDNDGYYEFTLINIDTKTTTEYFCTDCLQLRLNANKNTKCGNCNSLSIIHGELNSLDKEFLTKKWKDK